MSEDFNDIAVKRGGLSVVKKKVDAAVDAVQKGVPFGQHLVKPTGVFMTKFNKDGEAEEQFFYSCLKPIFGQEVPPCD